MTDTTSAGAISVSGRIAETPERTAAPARKPRVAVLGTGKMGAAIATRLADVGFELTLWNRTRQRAEALGLGSVANSPAEAVREADIAISSLTSADAVRAAYVGPHGALGCARGRLFVEMSTVGADLPCDLGAAAVASGGRLVDAPILASPALVRAGKGAIIVGGDDADVRRATPVLEAIGPVRHVGPLGNGARLKLVANSMLGALTLAAAELQVAGERAGLDPEDVFFVLQRHVPALVGRRAGYIEDRHEPVTFALRDLCKDIDLALELFAKVGALTPVTRHVRALVADAAVRHAGLEITAVARPYRQDAR